MKTFIILCALLYSVIGNQDYLKVLQKDCTIAGGYCEIPSKCPKGHLSEISGLCPSHHKLRQECCYHLTVEETHCQYLGGGCMGGCNPSIVIPEVNCGPGLHCCMLL